jgi:hypothetical protein
MDFRYDIADVWATTENHNKKRIFIQLVLREELKSEAVLYLESKKITDELVYPE